jgi:hypothetical protein
MAVSPRGRGCASAGRLDACRVRSCLASSNAWMCATASSGLMCWIAGVALRGAVPLRAAGLALAGRLDFDAGVAFFATGLPAAFVAMPPVREAALFGEALVAALLVAAGVLFPVATLFDAVFFDADFLATAFFGAAFLATAFFGAAFLATAFFGAAFLATAFFGAAFLAEAFFGAAFFTVAFLAGDFFDAVADREAEPLPVAFFAAGRAAVRLIGVLMPAFAAAVFFVALPAAAFLAADFFAADVRVVAMRHHSCGGQCSLARVDMLQARGGKTCTSSIARASSAVMRDCGMKRRAIQGACGTRSASSCRSWQANAPDVAS